MPRLLASGLRRLLGTTAFRLALTYALAYSLITAVVLGGVYLSSRDYLLGQVDTQLQATRDVLVRSLNGQDKDTLRDILGQLHQGLPDTHLYLLTRNDGQPLVGTLLSWPAGVPHKPGFYTFSAVTQAIPIADRSHDQDDPRARGLVARLESRHEWLLIVHPLDQVDAFTDTIQILLTLALFIITLIGMAGGVFMGRSVLSRIDAIREVTAEIMAGDLGWRIPAGSRQDEFAELARHLNAMLARIEALVEGMRAVTDNVAHDLRSPLTRLRNRLELALLEARSEHEFREALEAAVIEIEGVVRTFNALLSIAQAESGVRREQLRAVRLDTLIADIAELYGASAEAASLTLETETERPVWVHGSRELLAQALGNLLDNAIKYTPMGGQIHICLRQPGNNAELVVCDTGPGIPASSRERVLERFVRLDGARNTPGNGLGLALVKAVAQLHGAHLSLTDGQPGLCVHLCFRTLSDQSTSR